MKLALKLAAAVVALAIAGIIAGILIVQSQWFQNYIRQTILTSVEESTGGRAELGTLHFDWAHTTVVATDFVIHGTEAASAAPLLRVARVQLNLRLLPSLHHPWDISYLGVDRPQANVIVYSDGHTNVPSPRRKSTSNESPIEAW